MVRHLLPPLARSLIALDLSGIAGVHAADMAPTAPQIFAPGSISGRSDIAGGHLWRVDRNGDGWSAPIDLGDAVDRYQPWGSHLGPDGRTLYFTGNYTAKVDYRRSSAQASTDLERMRAWDNGNNHIWSVSLAPWLDAHRAM